MPIHRKSLFFLGLNAALLLLTPSAPASGAYTARPPRPPTSVSVDADKYNLGKQIYSGKAALAESAGPQAADQAERLKALQQKLPKSAQKSANLPALAGKLSVNQMKALEYYLEIRYKIK